MKDKRTYEKHKEHGEDLSHKNERKHMSHIGTVAKTVLSPKTHARNLASAALFEDRGSGDLTLQIEMLTKQKEYMQSKCREAGKAILDLEHQVNHLNKDNNILAKEVDRMNEYVQEMELQNRNNAKR